MTQECHRGDAPSCSMLSRDRRRRRNSMLLSQTCKLPTSSVRAAPRGEGCLRFVSMEANGWQTTPSEVHPSPAGRALHSASRESLVRNPRSGPLGYVLIAADGCLRSRPRDLSSRVAGFYLTAMRRLMLGYIDL